MQVQVQHIWLPTEKVSVEQQTQRLEGQESFCPQDSAWHAYCAQAAAQPVASAERVWEVTQAWKKWGGRGREEGREEYS